MQLKWSEFFYHSIRNCIWPRLFIIIANYNQHTAYESRCSIAPNSFCGMSNYSKISMSSWIRNARNIFFHIPSRMSKIGIVNTAIILLMITSIYTLSRHCLTPFYSAVKLTNMGEKNIDFLKRYFHYIWKMQIVFGIFLFYSFEKCVTWTWGRGNTGKNTP